MKKFIIYVSTVFLTVFGVMALTNYLVDPGHVYSDYYINTIIKGVQQGLNTTNVSNMDERLYKKELIKSYRDHIFDYIVLGSSRVMTVSEDAFSNSKVLNLGVSGCKIEDMMALLELCMEERIVYSNVLIGVDPTLFNGNDDDVRWKSLAKEYHSFIQKHYRRNYFDINKIQNLISPSYFRNSLDYLPHLLKGEYKIEYTSNVINDGFTCRFDGSIYYDKKYRECPQNKIDLSAYTWNHYSYKDFEVIDTIRTAMFETMLERIKQNGANVVFLEFPYHPTYYERHLKIQGVISAFRYIEKLAKSKGYEIIGSFNPAKIGFSNTDFYDPAHPRKESLDRITQL